MKFIFALLFVLICSGCAAIQKSELGGINTYAKCATFDVATTTIGLSTNLMHEANPLTRMLFIKAFGAVGGYVVPVIGLSIAGYYALKWLNKPAVTATVSGLTCFSAARNLWLIY